MSAFLLLAFWVLAPDKPLTPVWSPDRQTLASTEVSSRFVTPEGGDYQLLLNQKLVYPKKKRGWFSAYQNVHTFVSEFSWSPDSEHVAFVEKVYDWEYVDPFNSDFSGSASELRFYLAIVSNDGTARGYLLPEHLESATVRWQSPIEIDVNGRTFNLERNPPRPIR